MKFRLTLILFILCQHQSIAQVRTFQEIEKLQLTQPKPLIILVGTNWCKLCKAMEHALLKNKKVSAIVETNYYFLFLNVESKEDIHFNNKLYTFNHAGKQAGIHQLAYELGSTNGTITYPTLVILDQNFQLLFKHSTYLNPNAINTVLQRALLAPSRP